MASLGWEFRSADWSPTEIRRMLETVEQNPFSPIVEMDPGRNNQWRPYDAEMVRAALERSPDPETEFVLRSAPQYLGRIALAQFEAIPSRYLQEHNLIVRIMTDALQGEGEAQLLPFIRRLTHDLSQIYLVNTGVQDPKLTQFYSANDLPNLPKCLSNKLRWYYLLSPASYAEAYTAEVLLNAPAYSVRDVGNGMIEMICYESLLGYDTPEARQRVIDLTRYLDAHRKR